MATRELEKPSTPNNYFGQLWHQEFIGSVGYAAHFVLCVYVSMRITKWVVVYVNGLWFEFGGMLETYFSELDH